MPRLRIGICLDVLASDPRVTARIRQTLDELADRATLVVEPIYVLSKRELGISSDLVLWERYLLPVSLTAAADVKALTSERWEMKELQILVQDSASLNQRTKRLTEYAIASQTDLLITGTHARKGVSRILLGSFAESLLRHTPVPLITVSPDTEFQPANGKSFLLFATDLSEESENGLTQILPLAKMLGLGIKFLHIMPHLSATIVQSGVFLLAGSWVPANE